MAVKKEVGEEVVEEVAVKPVKKTTKKTAKETEEVAEVKKTTKKTTAKKAEVKEDAEKVEKVEKVEKAEKVEKTEKAEKPAKKTTTKKVPKDKTVQFWGTGRRKKSVARVRIMLGSGKFIINGRDIDNYFGLENLKVVARQPLTLVEMNDKFDVYVNVYGGGFTGQSGAIRMGLARALEKYDANLRPNLKKAGYLTRDARIKERKKYGLLKARKDQPFVKR